MGLGAWACGPASRAMVLGAGAVGGAEVGAGGTYRTSCKWDVLHR